MLSHQKNEPIKLHVGLNLLHALPEIGGVWNYIANLLGALALCDDTNFYTAFVNSESECLVPRHPNFRLVRVNLRASFRPRRVLYENTALQIRARKEHLDCMHWFGNTLSLFNLVPAIVTVYDLQPFRDFVHFSLVKRSYHRLIMPLTVQRASMLLPMSQATAQDLKHLFNANPAGMEVIPVILGSHFSRATEEMVALFRSRYGLPVRFWLYVAHMYPHKNHLRLLEAYHKLKSQALAPWPLVLRGNPKGAESSVINQIRVLGLESDIFFLPQLSEPEIPVLYSAASAMVFPSLYEGGGIPVVEAMACGCPIVASKIPAVQEYAAEAALYLDPYDIDSIESLMFQFQSNSELRERGRRLGLARSELYRPQAVIDKLLNAYIKASNKHLS